MHFEVSGADFKSFLEDGSVWHKQTYWDDTRIGVDGSFSEEEQDYSKIGDSAVVRIESGFLMNAPAGVPQDLMECVKWWLARRESVRLVITVPVAVRDMAIEALKGLGVTVHGEG